MLYKTTWLDKLLLGVSVRYRAHELSPNGCCASQAGHLTHRLVCCVSCPNSHYQTGGIPYRPVIMEIGRGACFNGSWLA